MQKAIKENKLKGRKRGIKHNKLDDKKNEITELLKENTSILQISKKLDVSYCQLYTFIKKYELNKKK